METQLRNCLVISLNAREFDFAVDLIKAESGAVLSPRSQQIIEGNKHLSRGSKVRILWIVGSKEETNSILESLRDKHNLHPRIMRDSYLRADFVHYSNGLVFNMNKRSFDRATQIVQAVGETV